jgi:hypothetical protein
MPSPLLEVAAKRDLVVRQCTHKYFELDESYDTENGEPTSEVSVIKALIKPINQRFYDLPITEFGAKKLMQASATTVANIENPPE